MKIRITRTGWIFVMIPVFGKQIFVWKESIDKDNERATGIVYFTIDRKYWIVHGIVSRDEKSCVKESLPNNGEGNQQRMKLMQISGEQKYQAGWPGADDGKCDE